MPPLALYLIPNPDDEVALARSAAPPSISADAEVLVLGKRAYETAVKGKNGFVCLVERAWANHLDVDDDEFWNAKMRGPNCYNAPAARTVLPLYLRRTEWVLAGASKQELVDRTRAALKGSPDPEPGSLSYMMSAQGHLNNRDGHWHPHLMFFVPRTSAANWGWGANLPGSPILEQEGDDTDPVTIFFVPVRRWSDGSPGPG